MLSIHTTNTEENLMMNEDLNQQVRCSEQGKWQTNAHKKMENCKVKCYKKIKKLRIDRFNRRR